MKSENFVIKHNKESEKNRKDKKIIEELKKIFPEDQNDETHYPLF